MLMMNGEKEVTVKVSYQGITKEKKFTEEEFNKMAIINKSAM